MTELVTALSQLGPALGAVAVIGLLCWKLLEMFGEHTKALTSIQTNMSAHTNSMDKMTQNIDVNTRMTERVVTLLEVKKR